MWRVIERISVVVGAFGIILIALGLAWYIFDIEWRLRSLEAQSLAKSVLSIDATNAPATDPLATACLAVSEKLSAEIADFPVSYRVDAYKEQLKLLNCSRSEK